MQSIGFRPQPSFYPGSNFSVAQLPLHQFKPNTHTVNHTAGQILNAMQHLQYGLASFGGAPFVGGFEPQPVGFPGTGSPFPFVGGFQPQPVGLPQIGSSFPFVGGFQPQPVGFPQFGGPLPFMGGFEPQPLGFPGPPLAGGGASLADRARLLQAGVSDSLIAGNIGFQSGAFGSLAGAQGAALAGPFFF